MKRCVFITGTDTGVGKSFVSCLLLRAFKQQGLKTFALKPIASGAKANAAGSLRNDDALQLQQHATIKKPYAVVNPICFAEAIAPHIAAGKMHAKISHAELCSIITSANKIKSDITLIEGVGGWSVPLNNTQLFSDVIVALGIPVVLVVAVKLGCLNHALLTYQRLQALGTPVIAWVANCLHPDTLSIEDNIATLKNWIDKPCLGVVPYNCRSPDCLDTDLIVNFGFQNCGVTR